MKLTKIHLTLIISILIMIITIMISFSLESRSQKLPAVVKADKIVVSSSVNGILERYEVSDMQHISRNKLLASISNEQLKYKLEALLQEKEKYEELIASASNGDALEIELLELEEKIRKNHLEKDEHIATLNLVKENLNYRRERFQRELAKHNLESDLYDNGILSLSDYRNASQDFWEFQEKFMQLKSDSLLAERSIKNSEAIISALATRKKILSKNTQILAAKYLLELDKLLIEIHDIQENIAALSLISPVNGIVTDLSKRSGEVVNKGDVIAEISDLNNIWITAYGNSFSTRKILNGNRVVIYGNSGEKLSGVVRSISPVMEKVKSLSNSYETVNTYTKIEIDFENKKTALHKIIPGERLFVRILY